VTRARGDAGGFGENVIPAVSDLAKLRYGLGEVALLGCVLRRGGVKCAVKELNPRWTCSRVSNVYSNSGSVGRVTIQPRCVECSHPRSQLYAILCRYFLRRGSFMSQPPMPQGPPPQPAQFPLYPSGPVQPSASTTSPAPPKPKLFGWPTVIITAVVAFSLGGITAVVALSLVGIFVGSGDDTATTAEPTATVTATKPAEAESATASKAPAAKKTTEPDPENTMNEGTYEIGVDANPGRYKTRVPQDSPVCYWEKMKDDSGGFNSLIANGEVNAGGRVSITVKRGEFFNSEDCGTWTRV
jgi:hypothetical protein